MAACAERVDAVEEWRPSARLLSINMESNGIRNVRVFADSAENFMRDAESNCCRYDAIVLDPPRTGCDERVLSGVRSIAPESVLYVSCNPATMARDIRRLSDEGEYHVVSVEAFDMFPQTAHVESICLMKRSRKI
jgi:23S rRNA (uracil1939-C5)-methyltransferase